MHERVRRVSVGSRGHGEQSTTNDLCHAGFIVVRSFFLSFFFLRAERKSRKSPNAGQECRDAGKGTKYLPHERVDENSAKVLELRADFLAVLCHFPAG